MNKKKAKILSIVFVAIIVIIGLFVFFVLYDDGLIKPPAKKYAITLSDLSDVYYIEEESEMNYEYVLNDENNSKSKLLDCYEVKFGNPYMPTGNKPASVINTIILCKNEEYAKEIFKDEYVVQYNHSWIVNKSINILGDESIAIMRGGVYRRYNDYNDSYSNYSEYEIYFAFREKNAIAVIIIQNSVNEPYEFAYNLLKKVENNFREK